MATFHPDLTQTIEQCIQQARRFDNGLRVYKTFLNRSSRSWSKPELTMANLQAVLQIAPENESGDEDYELAQEPAISGPSADCPPAPAYSVQDDSPKARLLGNATK